jgi:carbonic anhydrase
VSWAVFKEPVKVSQEQIDDFAALYPKNNRPLQDQGRRFILVGG